MKGEFVSLNAWWMVGISASRTAFSTSFTAGFSNKLNQLEKLQPPIRIVLLSPYIFCSRKTYGNKFFSQQAARQPKNHLVILKQRLWASKRSLMAWRKWSSSTLGFRMVPSGRNARHGKLKLTFFWRGWKGVGCVWCDGVGQVTVFHLFFFGGGGGEVQGVWGVDQFFLFIFCSCNWFAFSVPPKQDVIWWREGWQNFARNRKKTSSKVKSQDLTMESAQKIVGQRVKI